MKYLIVGLGNIGSEYADTRHNAGFLVADTLAARSGAPFTSDRYGSVAVVRHRGQELIVLKPSTYMNLSGKAVRYWMEAAKIPAENLLVVSDDIAIPFGQLRMRQQGSAGGHNGLKSILYLTGKDTFPRVKMGVGQKPHPDYDLADWVLGKFRKEDTELLDKMFDHAAEAAQMVVEGQIDQAMSRFNG